MKLRRILPCLILGFLWLFSLLLTIFLLPKLYADAKATFDTLSYAVVRTVVFAGLYGLAPAFFGSILNHNAQFAIRSTALRILLLLLGAAILVFYAVGLFYSSSELMTWLWEFPTLFFPAGALLYCGFCRKKS